MTQTQMNRTRISWKAALLSVVVSVCLAFGMAPAVASAKEAPAAPQGVVGPADPLQSASFTPDDLQFSSAWELPANTLSAQAAESALGAAGASGELSLLDGEFLYSISPDGTMTITGEGAMPDFSSTVAAEYVVKYRDSIRSIVVDEGITRIGDMAFSTLRLVQEVQLPDSLESIGRGAFAYCTNLQEITIPKSVKTIDRQVFFECSSLYQVIFAKDSQLQTIGDSAFPSFTDLVNFPKTLTRLENGAYGIMAHVKVNATDCYDYAFQVVGQVNKHRQNAGLPALTMDKTLLGAAMLRATETALYWHHMRPNGTSYKTISPLLEGENIAGAFTSPTAVVDGWMNSQEHRAHIMNSVFSSTGVGCVMVDGVFYWVQVFGSAAPNKATSSAYKNKLVSRTINVSPEQPYYRPTVKVTGKSLAKGAKGTVKLTWQNGIRTVLLPVSDLKHKVSKKGIIGYSKGTITAKKPGNLVFSLYFPGYEQGAIKNNILVGAPAKPKPTSFENLKGRKAVLKWSKSPVCSGYEIMYAQSKNFSGAKTIKVGKTTGKKTLTNLKKGKTCYVKMRSYTVQAGKKVYSSWTAPQSVKIKK